MLKHNLSRLEKKALCQIYGQL